MLLFFNELRVFHSLVHLFSIYCFIIGIVIPFPWQKFLLLPCQDGPVTDMEDPSAAELSHLLPTTILASRYVRSKLGVAGLSLRYSHAVNAFEVEVDLFLKRQHVHGEIRKT